MSAPADILALPAEALTAHRPPALLVARVLSCESDGSGSVEVAVHLGLDALQLCEACAQALAVLMGCRMRQMAGRPAAGWLVGLKGMIVTRPARPGERLVVQAQLLHELPPLTLHAVRLSAGDETLLSGEIKTYQTQEGQP